MTRRDPLLIIALLLLGLYHVVLLYAIFKYL